MKRLHIVGCPRSGTTLLMELVSTCFASDGYCEHELSIFEPIEAEAEIYFTKQPNDIRQLSHIFGRDEQLFVIYMGRDPRAVITSKHRQNPEEYFCNYRVWRECDRAAQDYEQHPRFLRLRYEDLVNDADAVQRQICQRFEFLQQLHLFSEFHQYARPSEASQRAMNGLREVNRESLEKWRQHLPRVAQQLRDHPELAQDLQRLGYEPDEQWTSVLEGVQPVLYPCRYPERKPYLKDWERNVRVFFKSRRYLRQRCS
ncbi:hypothetical protein E2F43_06340 [Seongchinamella unica]|uniref:Sulfotransferase family protein n=1 Tax=Seongchinamella unica TaxID=2547392 RepID=A0A4R5LWM6_9GAMM|nr:sulfotransferase [Seongchinamella unica]TDG15841.1 hypothetical protein E2F43_06340 [Seongchinamella unica]